MSIKQGAKTNHKKGAGCAPFLTALALLFLLMVAVILALIVANAMGITMAPSIIYLI